MIAKKKLSGETLVKLITQLHITRKEGKIKGGKRKSLTFKQRQYILSKTDSKCHICGIDLSGNNFQADHVKSHISGGMSVVDNYLPSCSTCNNYRWHYLPEEIQLILKIGVWAKTKIERKTQLGLLIADGFTKHDTKVRKR